MSRPPIHDLTGLGDLNGVFTRVLFCRNCGIVVYETRDTSGFVGKTSISTDKRAELKRWFSGAGLEPIWWTGWPARRI